MTSRVLSLARGELRLQLRDGRIRLTAAIFAALCTLSVLIGWKRHADAEQMVHAAQRETYEQFLTQGRNNPHSGAHFGMYAFRPEPALAFFDRGIDDYTGIAVFLEPHHPSRFRDLPAQDQTTLGRFGQWTLGAILQGLVPLLVILLAAPSIAVERERGTLRLLFSEGVRKWELFAGKALGIGAALALTLLPALLLAAFGGFLFSGASPLAPGRVAFMVVGYALYLTAFLFIALAIGSRTRTAQGAVVLALGFWSVAAVIGPRVFSDQARRTAPAPTAFAFRQRVEAQSWAHDMTRWSEHEAALTRTILQERGVASVDDLPINVAGVVLQAQEDEEAPLFDREYGILHQAFLDQERTLTRGSIAAPLLAIQAVSMAAAGTDTAHSIHFWRAAEDHRRTMVKILNDYLATRSRSKDGYDFLVGSEAWGLVPAFSYAPPPAAFAATNALPSLGVLFGWALAAVLACAVASRTMQVDE